MELSFRKTSVILSLPEVENTLAMPLIVEELPIISISVPIFVYSSAMLLSIAESSFVMVSLFKIFKSALSLELIVGKFSCVFQFVLCGQDSFPMF